MHEESYPQEQQQQPQFYVPSYLSSDQWRFDTTKILEEVRHFLKGEALVDKTWTKIGEQLINDDGINKTMALLNKVINSNTLMSYLEEKEIYTMTLTIGKELNGLYYREGDDFKIDPSSHPLLVHQLTHFVFITLKRALEGGERKSLTQSYEEKRIIAEGVQKDKGFRVPNIFGRGDKEGNR